MARDPVYAEFAYMTFDDIRQLNNLSDDPEQKDTLIAVKAPIGSKIEIPDPEQLEMIYRQYNEEAENIKKF